LTKIKNVRGTDRDSFYVQIGGFDNHSNLKSEFSELVAQVDAAIGAFIAEMKSQGIWENVVLVGVSEFARTLTPNSGYGSDHGWGGNYFVLGGTVKGGTILGDYPDNLTLYGPQITEERGRVIPTRPWDSVWNGICQWFGVTNTEELDVVLPNRNKFTDVLFSKEQMFGDGGGVTGVTIKAKVIMTLSSLAKTAPKPVREKVKNVLRAHITPKLKSKNVQNRVGGKFIKIDLLAPSQRLIKNKNRLILTFDITFHYEGEPKVFVLKKTFPAWFKKKIGKQFRAKVKKASKRYFKTLSMSIAKLIISL